MPAPKGNINAMKNATRSTVRRLVVGEFPKQLNHVKIEGRKYRLALENAVLDAHGEVTITACHLIDTASSATVHAGICRWLLRQKISTMSTADILACSREMLRAKQARDIAVRQLKLDRDDRNVIDALYTTEPDPLDTHENRLQGGNAKQEGDQA